MRSAAEAIALVPSAARILSITSITVSPKRPRKRTRSIACATGPICARARSCRRNRERVTDRYDDLPNSFDLRHLRRRRTLQFDPHQRADVGMAGSPSSEMFSDLLHPELDRGKVIVDPTRFVADPDKAKRFPELPYLTVRLGYVACDYFNADIGLAIVRPEHQAFYRRVFLHEPWGEPRLYPGPDQAGRADGGRLSRDARKGLPALSLSCARAPSSGGCCSSAAASRMRRRPTPAAVRAGIDRPAVLIGSAGASPDCGEAASRSFALAGAVPVRIGSGEIGPKPRFPRASPACLHPRATFTTH